MKPEHFLALKILEKLPQMESFDWNLDCCIKFSRVQERQWYSLSKVKAMGKVRMS